MDSGKSRKNTCFKCFIRAAAQFIQLTLACRGWNATLFQLPIFVGQPSISQLTAKSSTFTSTALSLLSLLHSLPFHLIQVETTLAKRCSNEFSFNLLANQNKIAAVQSLPSSVVHFDPLFPLCLPTVFFPFNPHKTVNKYSQLSLSKNINICYPNNTSR